MISCQDREYVADSMRVLKMLLLLIEAAMPATTRTQSRT